VEAAPLQAVVSSSAGPIDAALLSDGHLLKGVALPFPQDGTPAWLRWDLGRPRSIRALTLAFGGTPQLDFLIDTASPQAELQASDDGVAYHSIARLNNSAVGQRTIAFAPTPAASAADVIAGTTVIDLTSRVAPDGALDWTPPRG
jgi:hypothetical protein